VSFLKIADTLIILVLAKRKTAVSSYCETAVYYLRMQFVGGPVPVFLLHDVKYNLIFFLVFYF